MAEWDPTPECDEDWYAHTIDVAFRGGKRYVTMPAELFLQKDESTDSGLAEMTDEDKEEGGLAARSSATSATRSARSGSSTPPTSRSSARRTT